MGDQIELKTDGVVTLHEMAKNQGVISFHNEKECVVKLDLRTGDVEISPGYTPTDAARLFWQAVSKFGSYMAHPIAVIESGRRLLKLKVDLPEGIDRVETGYVQFNEDWPGVFIRGDHALHDSLCIRMLFQNSHDVFSGIAVKNLGDLLSGCNAQVLDAKEKAP